MATHIVFAGGESIYVTEKLADVVGALGGDDDLVQVTRTAAYSDPGTVEGKAVHVRRDAVLYVTET